MFIYTILVWICMFIVLLTSGGVKIFFLGLEIGIALCQIIAFIKEYYL